MKTSLVDQSWLYHYEQMTPAQKRAAGLVHYAKCPWPTEEDIARAYQKLAKARREEAMLED